MSFSDHKAADELAGAVERHIKSSNADSQHGYHLIGVYKAARRAASTTNIGASALDHIRSSLCCACRGHGLYPCDVSRGWSTNCAFVQNNK
jgi:hypothetical protein